MPTRTEIIEAGARAIHESQCCPLDENSECDLSDAPVSLVETALSAMLPLIKEALAEEVRGRCEGHKARAGGLTWCHACRQIWPCDREGSARIIEEYEPTP